MERNGEIRYGAEKYKVDRNEGIRNGVERNGAEKYGVERNGAEIHGVERNGAEIYGVDQSAKIQCGAASYGTDQQNTEGNGNIWNTAECN